MAQYIKSLKNGMDALNLLANEGPKTVNDIAKHLGVHRTSAHRLLATLASGNFVHRSSDNGLYHLGPQLIRLGHALITSSGVRKAVGPQLEWLATETREAAVLKVPYDRFWAVCLESAEGDHAVQTLAKPGRVTPLHVGGTGKAILAHLPAETVDAMAQEGLLKPYTDKTLVEPAALKEQLEIIRLRGYSISLGEIEEGASAIGAPIFDVAGKVVAAISIAGPAHRLTAPDRQPGLIKAVLMAAERASEMIGFSFPDDSSPAVG